MHEHTQKALTKDARSRAERCDADADADEEGFGYGEAASSRRSRSPSLQISNKISDSLSGKHLTKGMNY